MGVGIRLDDNDVMERPNRYDEVVVRRAAEMALSEVKRCMHDIGPDEEILEDLMSCINGSDGYEIVKGLESKGWCGNAVLVECMDQNFIGDAERELVEQWVKCLGVTLEYEIGTHVRIKNRAENGVIVSLYPETAKYGVRTPEQRETSNWVVNKEDVEAI